MQYQPTVVVQKPKVEDTFEWAEFSSPLSASIELYSPAYSQEQKSMVEDFTNAPVAVASPQSDDEYESLEYYNLELSFSSLNGHLSWTCPNFSPDSAYFVHAFVHGFMNAVSPQLCHPRLTPAAVFVPQGKDSPLMQEIFAACGAAFLASNKPNMTDVARRRYAICLDRFANELSASDGLIKEWMVGAALLFCLRDKLFGAVPTQPASHLLMALQILRKLRTQAGVNTIVLKFMIESFLFNYSVVLLTCDHAVVRRFPSPFRVFDEWREIFELKPYDCTAWWMNNPVFGAASGAFEITAKVSWLSFKYPLNNQHMITACELLMATYKLNLPKTLDEMREQLSPSEFLHIEESVKLAEVLNTACQLLLAKLMNPKLEQTDALVQLKVAAIYDLLLGLSPSSQEWIICGWPLLVTGAAAILPKHREYIVAACLRCYKLYHTAFMRQIADFLARTWGSEMEPGAGWDALFDRNLLLTVCI